MRELVNLFFGKRDVRYTAEHRYCLPLSTEFQTHKNSRNPHFTGFRCTLRRAIDGTRTRDLHLGKVAYYQLYYYRIFRMTPCV